MRRAQELYLNKLLWIHFLCFYISVSSSVKIDGHAFRDPSLYVDDEAERHMIEIVESILRGTAVNFALKVGIT